MADIVSYEEERYLPLIPTPSGMVPLVGTTMSVERERELFGKEARPNEQR